MSFSIRAATVSDLPAMAHLSELKRLQYQHYQPVFWRKAADSLQRQLPFFSTQLHQPDNRVLVAEESAQILGFLIGMIRPAPPVYDPGGLTCIVDDFMVATPDLWPTVGQQLLDRLTQAVRNEGVVQMVVICGHQDAAKRTMLEEAGYPIASEWRVRTIRNE